MVFDPTLSQAITGISSMATRNVLADLVEQYARHSRQRVVVESVGGVEAARRVLDGEPFDIVVLSADAIDRLVAAGRVVAGTRADLARSGVAIAVAAGATQPEIASEAAVRDAILAARSIGYSTGPSGSHLVRLFERWGIAETIAPRIVQAPPGIPVGSLVASGDVELGFQQLSELMHLPGIDVVGTLPPDIQVVTIFSAAVCTTSEQRAEAQALISFLVSPQAASAKLAHGMEPA
ncbi:substrate-binding domain-containing protein [Paraburkholderia sediminicola]|uniref:substrate-binding domain-containing protein n=1 Tax=Paraburkholderia sediminicola TaxID=458836 RepID=UPI0038B868CF